MGQTTVHSSKATTATLNGQKVVAFADGDDALMVERNVGVGEGLVGMQGDSIWSQSNDMSAKITIKLLQTSPTHKLLSEQLRKQRNGTPRGVPFAFVDRINNEGGSAAQCFIMTEPGVQKGKNATTREWVLWTGSWNGNIPSGGV